jgi:hypothetical protein
MKNIYMLQTLSGEYRKVSRARCNQAVESGKAHWVGSDPDPDNDAVIHYADRGGEE